MSNQNRPFHLAFPVRDLGEAEAFYCGTLGCTKGRSAPTWLDFDLYGHQMSAHLRQYAGDENNGVVDGVSVPIPHFGVILRMDEWRALAARLECQPGIVWIEKPMIRFAGEPGEQATLFVRDPSGNALEFKGFADLDKVFAE